MKPEVREVIWGIFEVRVAQSPGLIVPFYYFYFTTGHSRWDQIRKRTGYGLPRPESKPNQHRVLYVWRQNH